MRPTFVLIFVFIAAYTEIPFVLGAGEVPAFLLVIAFPLLWLIAKRYVNSTDVWSLGGIMAVALLSIFLVPNWGDVKSRIVGFGQLLFSATLALLTAKTILAVGREAFHRLMFGIYLTLLIGLLLERYFGLGAVSDAFRYFVYQGSYMVYDGDARDLNMAGFVRPKLFTSEPSLAALGICVAGFGALLTSSDTRRMTQCFLMSLCAWFLCGSPIAAVPAMIVPLTILSGRVGWPVKAFSVAFVVGAVFSAFSSPGDLGRFDLEQLNVAYAGSDKQNESSERLRITYPYVSAIDAIRVNPLLGLGVGGKRSLERYSSFTDQYDIAIGNNSFATIFVFWGAFGGIAILLIYLNFLRMYGASLLVVCPLLFLQMQAIGGLETPRSCVFIAFTSAAAILNRRG